MAVPTAWPIHFASGANPGVKRKISKTKTEVETKEIRKRQASCTDIQYQMEGRSGLAGI
jgi:hypothetical protein